MCTVSSLTSDAGFWQYYLLHQWLVSPTLCQEIIRYYLGVSSAEDCQLPSGDLCGDVVFVSVDTEGISGNHKNPREFGISTLDTRDLSNGTDPEMAIRSYSYVFKMINLEHARYRPFLFGRTQIVRR